ncbi:hypothetical protein [Streptomyces formicae]|uniref:Uncharacterized protein n=1 Tax=Streptomyces formicae TaxID=1616117 RepID=A0ABY3WH69_9ACTN|nr:hypothetical protein [Streptomyces formicae]UNM10122.1 hypothetical protein J4032_00100 [Streptomyces formicae]
MQQINADVQEVLDRSLAAIGLSGHWERRHFPQHTGDGYVAGMNAEVLPALVGSFPEAVRAELWQWRRANPRLQPLQLRVSVHVGPLPADGLGVPMVHTHRLLDDQALRDLLARADPEVTNTAVIVSERVYEDVFESGLATGATVASQFAQRFVRVKTFARPARLHVPGLDWGLADPSIFEVPEGPHPGPARPPQPTAGGASFHQYGPGGTQGITNNVRNEFGGGQGA